MKTRILYTLNKILLVVSLLCYLSVWVSPAQWWEAGFLALGVPVAMFLNGCYLLFWIIKRKYTRMYWSAAALVCAFPFYNATLALHIADTEATNQYKTVSVLSYNVRALNVYHKDNPKHELSKQQIQWIVDNQSDIKCFQEFYDQKNSKVFNTIERLTYHTDYPHYQFQQTYPNDVFGWYGMAVVSRYPIVNEGIIKINQRFNYGAMFADIKIRKDTLRVYNVHLQSMYIKESEIMDMERVEEDSKMLARKLKKGFTERARQVEILLQHISESPYPVVLCGDFNEMPYSYVYMSVKKQLHNAFEKAGAGFGFSYNGKLFFLRIDHQFFSPTLRAFSLQTFSQIPYSDHFPIQAKYELP